MRAPANLTRASYVLYDNIWCAPLSHSRARPLPPPHPFRPSSRASRSFLCRTAGGLIAPATPRRDCWCACPPLLGRNTNYPAWYPFGNDTNGNLAWRFSVRVSGAGGGDDSR